MVIISLWEARARSMVIITLREARARSMVIISLWKSIWIFNVVPLPSGRADYLVYLKCLTCTRLFKNCEMPAGPVCLFK